MSAALRSIGSPLGARSARLLRGVRVVPSAALDAGTPGFTIATAPYAFVFPRDHGAHPGYQSEWWYYTGHVRTTDGRRFGYELTFFRVGLAPGDPRRCARRAAGAATSCFRRTSH